jgi:hypothetical protein
MKKYYKNIILGIVFTLIINAGAARAEELSCGKDFIANLLQKTTEILKQKKGAQEFVNLMSKITDYKHITQKIIYPYTKEKGSLSPELLKRAEEAVKKIIEEKFITKAYNPNVTFNLTGIEKVKSNHINVKIFAKIPDGRVFDLTYLLECNGEEVKKDEKQSNCKDKCKIKDVSAEGIPVSKIYSDSISSLTEEQNPTPEDLILYLKNFTNNENNIKK